MSLADHAFPILSFQQLLNSPKGRKPQDMKRILHSPVSEDWVTWNFFQLLLRRYPMDWWAHFLKVARRRNSNSALKAEDNSVPIVRFWSSIPCPPEY
jgi:hypothetical protein